MELKRGGRRYEGLRATCLVALALMEQSGIRGLIDEIVGEADGHTRERALSPGMAVKALVGPPHDLRKKLPLSGVEEFYNAAPVDLIFGPGVTLDSLNDHALARNLESIHEAGPVEMYSKCAALAKKWSGLGSKVLHGDSTNFSVWAVRPDSWAEGEVVPAFCGNPKDKRKDLLHYAVCTIVDGDRVMVYYKQYPGNASDAAMDKDALEHLAGLRDRREHVFVADCKLVDEGLINAVLAMEMGFVSKLPERFSGLLRDKLVDEALAGGMAESSVAGYETREMTADTVCGPLRFVAFRNGKGTARALDYLERQGRRDAERLFKPFAKKRFACEADALAAFEDASRAHTGSAWAVTGSAVRHEGPAKRKGRGRPPKGEPAPEPEAYWKVGVSMAFDAAEAARLADERAVSVIVTNLPRADKDAANVRHGATTDTVLRLYLDQYKVEHAYRLLKSDIGVDEVYVRTPARVSGLLFAVAIAALLFNVADAVIRKKGLMNGRRPLTVRQAYDMAQNAIIECDRAGGFVSVLGPEGSEGAVFSLVDAIGLDPSALLATSGG